MSTTLRYDLTRVVETNLPELKRVLGLADLHVREGQEEELVSRLVSALEMKVVHDVRHVPPARAPAVPMSTAGKCFACLEVLPKGTRAQYVRGKGMIHPECEVV